MGLKKTKRKKKKTRVLFLQKNLLLSLKNRSTYVVLFSVIIVPSVVLTTNINYMLIITFNQSNSFVMYRENLEIDMENCHK